MLQTTPISSLTPQLKGVFSQRVSRQSTPSKAFGTDDSGANLFELFPCTLPEPGYVAPTEFTPVSTDGAELFELFPCALPEPGYVAPTESNLVKTRSVSLQSQGSKPMLPTVYLNEMPMMTAFAFEGTAMADTLVGTEDSDAIAGHHQNDTLTGLGGNDILSGDAGHDTLLGNRGHDRLMGGNGSDTLQGGAGADNLQGGAGRDRLQGGNGNDTLRGDLGQDVLSGDAGNDVFVLKAGLGTDMIEDFVKGEDRLGLMNLNFADLTINQVGINTVISASNQSLAVLTHVTASTIALEDFVQVAIAW